MQTLADKNSQKTRTLHLRAKDIDCYWTSVQEIFDSIISEVNEVKDALQQAESQDRVSEEIGDLYLGVIELCYYLKLEPNVVLAQSLDKFQKRLEGIEEIMKTQGLSSLHSLSTQEKQELWDRVKKTGAAEED